MRHFITFILAVGLIVGLGKTLGWLSCTGMMLGIMTLIRWLARTRAPARASVLIGAGMWAVAGAWVVHALVLLATLVDTVPQTGVYSHGVVFDARRKSEGHPGIVLGIDEVNLYRVGGKPMFKVVLMVPWDSAPRNDAERTKMTGAATLRVYRDDSVADVDVPVLGIPGDDVSRLYDMAPVKTYELTTGRYQDLRLVISLDKSYKKWPKRVGIAILSHTARPTKEVWLDATWIGWIAALVLFILGHLLFRLGLALHNKKLEIDATVQLEDTQH